jgi:monothiol glutaredoxin
MAMAANEIEALIKAALPDATIPGPANLRPRIRSQPMSTDAHARIQAEIDAAPVMLFMKGTAMFPQCGFSARVVQILSHLAVPFRTANVLEDPELREGIKEFSNWPTIPQLYVKGEFVGGCDIITEMFQSGELETLLADKGIPHQAAA